MNDLEIAIRTIRTEIAGLEALVENLDARFTQAVDIIDTMKKERRGRLIVSGVGKSGHVAKKLVATLASTGTPSHFVHPGEASHGDLGMVMGGDVVLMISYSGENAELSDMIAYTRRFDIPLIAITGGADSALARHADIALLMPRSPEACPNGLAPTTSTTMTMALGDALAVALLERMGLTPEQFSVFHPGGKLGQKLLKVAAVMQDMGTVPLIRSTETMDKAILLLTEKNIGCVLVSDDGKTLAGIITDGDLKRHMAPDLLQKPVADIMNRSAKTISDSALVAEAVKIMTQTPGRYITSLVAVDGAGNISGLIRLQDCLQSGAA